jgi:hypothetical protein
MDHNIIHSWSQLGSLLHQDNQLLPTLHIIQSILIQARGNNSDNNSSDNANCAVTQHIQSIEQHLSASKNNSTNDLLDLKEQIEPERTNNLASAKLCLDSAHSALSLLPSSRDVYYLVHFYLFLRRFVKGFLAGYSVKFLLSLIGIIFRKKPSKSSKFQSVIRVSTQFSTVRYGLFLGTFLSLFETLYSLRISAFRSSCVAGLAFLFIPRASRVTFAMFVFVRAFEVVVKQAVAAHYLPKFQHADTLLMALSSAELMYSYLFHHDIIEPSYRKFLDIHSGKTREVCEGIILLKDGAAGLFSNEKVINGIQAHRVAAGLKALDYFSSNLPCELQHGHTSSCGLELLHFLYSGIVRALYVYVPVYTIPLVLFRWKSLFSAPLSSLSHTFLNISRSSLFLSSYCGLCWYSADLLWTIFGYHKAPKAAIIGFCGGLAVLLENKHRRIELALYVLAQSLQTAYIRLYNARRVPYFPHFESLLFILSTAIILRAFAANDSNLRPGYSNLLNSLLHIKHNKATKPCSKLTAEEKGDNHAHNRPTLAAS